MKWLGILTLVFGWELALADDSLPPLFNNSGVQETILSQDTPIGSQAQTNRTTGNVILNMRDGTQYVISAPILPPEMEAQLGEMSKEELELFFKKREAFLERAARIFHNSTKLAYGSGTLFKDKLYQIVRGRNNLIHPIKDISNSVQFEDLNSIKGQPENIKKYIIKTQNLLAHLDYQLWVGAPVVAKQNEFGIALFGGVGGGFLISNSLKTNPRVDRLLHKISEKSFFNSLSFGLGIGFNYEKRTIVFDIFKEVESAIRALTVIAPTISLKVYLYSANRDQITTQHGKGTYAPGPFDVKVSKNTLFIGISPIPTPEMMYAYEANFNRYSILNASFGALLPRFVRLSSTMNDFIKDGLESVQSLSEKIVGLFRPKSVYQCSMLF